MTDTTLLADAIAERAMIYHAIYSELHDRYGADTATDVLRAAIRKHGRGFGRQLFADHGKDFETLVHAFAHAPDNGATFQPEIRSITNTTAEVHMTQCPLKQAWLDAGLSEEMVARMLYCASAIDEGTLDEAGIDADIETWSPGQNGCCRLRLTRR